MCCGHDDNQHLWKSFQRGNTSLSISLGPDCDSCLSRYAQIIVNRFHVSSSRWMSDLPCLGRELTLSTILALRPPRQDGGSLESCLRDNLAKGPDELCWLLCYAEATALVRAPPGWLISSSNLKSPVVCCQIFKVLYFFDPFCDLWNQWWMEQGWAPCTWAGQPGGLQ